MSRHTTGVTDTIPALDLYFLWSVAKCHYKHVSSPFRKLLLTVSMRRGLFFVKTVISAAGPNIAEKQSHFFLQGVQPALSGVREGDCRRMRSPSQTPVRAGQILSSITLSSSLSILLWTSKSLIYYSASKRRSWRNKTRSWEIHNNMEGRSHQIIFESF